MFDSIVSSPLTHAVTLAAGFAAGAMTARARWFAALFRVREADPTRLDRLTAEEWEAFDKRQY